MFHLPFLHPLKCYTPHSQCWNKTKGILKARCCFCFYHMRFKQGLRKQTAEAVISSVCGETSTLTDSRERFNQQADRSSDNQLFKLIWKKALYIQHLQNSLVWCLLGSWQKKVSPPTTREAARFRADTDCFAFISPLGHIIHPFSLCYDRLTPLFWKHLNHVIFSRESSLITTFTRIMSILDNISKHVFFKTKQKKTRQHATYLLSLR